MKLLLTLRRELARVVLLFLIGLAIIHYSTPLAIHFDFPAAAVWGLFLGGVFWVAAISHGMRRILFPHIDLRTFAMEALYRRNVAAAIVFLGVCVVLGTLIIVSGGVLSAAPGGGS